MPCRSGLPRGRLVLIAVLIKQSILLAVLTRESSADSEADKKADLAGPGIGDYAEWEYFHLRGVSKPMSPRNSVS